MTKVFVNDKWTDVPENELRPAGPSRIRRHNKWTNRFRKRAQNNANRLARASQNQTARRG